MLNQTFFVTTPSLPKSVSILTRLASSHAHACQRRQRSLLSRTCVLINAIAHLIYANSVLNVPWQQQQYATARLAVVANSCAVTSKRLPPRDRLDAAITSAIDTRLDTPVDSVSSSSSPPSSRRRLYSCQHDAKRLSTLVSCLTAPPSRLSNTRAEQDPRAHQYGSRCELCQ